MLAGFNCRRHVKGVELGGVGDDHHIHAFNHALITIEARETVCVVCGHLVRILHPDKIALLLRPLHQQVRHGGDPDTLVGVHRLCRRFGAAPSASDDAHPDNVASLGVCACGDRQRGNHAGGGL